MGSFDDTLEVDETPRIIGSESHIKHHGVLGMKWGKRMSSISEASNKGGTALNQSSQLINKLGTARGRSKTLKKATTMSDDDLKTLVQRMELENRYANATMQRTGESKVGKILETAGSVTMIVGSIAGTAAAIHNIRNK